MIIPPKVFDQAYTNAHNKITDAYSDYHLVTQRRDRNYSESDVVADLQSFWNNYNLDPDLPYYNVVVRLGVEVTATVLLNRFYRGNSRFTGPQLNLKLGEIIREIIKIFID